MKNFKLKMISVALIVILSLVGMIACNPFIEDGEEIDESKVQLYVGTFNQGFGKEWLEKAATRFSEANKNKSFKDGTTGVQVLIDSLEIADSLIGSFSMERSEIVFNESVDYYAWVQKGYTKDITNIVKADMASVGESGESIYGKMYKPAQDYYKYTDGKYYGIPFYESTYGIFYDIDVFEANNLFMDGSGNFTLSSQTAAGVSSGPDGDIATTVDNGLPATFSDFYKLCDTMKTRGLQPLTFTGKNANYISLFAQSMAMYLDGYEQSMLRFTLDGYADKIVDKLDGDVPVLKTPAVKIDKTNGYLLNHSQGEYYALKFIEGLANGKYYVEQYLNSTAYSHLDAQNDFVTNNTARHKNSIKKDIGMLIDGTWFLNEASSTMLNLSKVDFDAGADVRKFGLMPLPHPDGWDPLPFTYVDGNAAMCFVNAKTDESKMELVGEFLKFLHTDEELRKFTEETSTLRGYKYLDGYDVSDHNTKATPYAKQLISLRQQIGDRVIYPISSNTVYANNSNKMFYDELRFFSSKIDNTTATLPWSSMTGSNKVSAKRYFEGMMAFHSQSDWNTNYGKFL